MITTVLFDGFGTLLAGGFSQDADAITAVCRTFNLEIAPDTLLEQCYRSVAEVREQLGHYQVHDAPPPPFYPLRWWYERFFEHAFGVLQLHADPRTAAMMTLARYGEALPYPEAAGVLEALQAAYRLGLLSNADDDFLDAATGHLDLPLQLVLSSEQAGVYKPHPEAFRIALDRLGSAPDETLYVGDNQVDDVLGAHTAGLRVAWVNRTGQELRSDVPAPDFIVPDLSLLPTLLRDL